MSKNSPGGSARPAADYSNKERGDGYGPPIAGTSRRQADQNSNLNGAPPMPEWADIGMENMAPGTSIFDPVLCELAYLWFSPKDGKVLDPFAGGSVRGIVASKMGRRYLGVDLRQEQIDANQQQAKIICDDTFPDWRCGNSLNILNIAPDYQADFLFSCPPYGDLEVYSDDPDDISNMEHEKFLEIYYKIIKYSVALLAQDRFACFVVGDFRDSKGIYRNFVSHTIAAFEQAGAQLYNEAILVTALGSLPIRAARVFSASRKLGKTHQNVLVFVKGDPKKATEACGTVEIVELEEKGEGNEPSPDLVTSV